MNPEARVLSTEDTDFTDEEPVSRPGNLTRKVRAILRLGRGQVPLHLCHLCHLWINRCGFSRR